METPSKILLLTAMYGLPLCFVIFYSVIENIKQKRKVMNEKFIHQVHNNNRKVVSKLI